MKQSVSTEQAMREADEAVLSATKNGGVFLERDLRAAVTRAHWRWCRNALSLVGTRWWSVLLRDVRLPGASEVAKRSAGPA